MMRPSFVPLLAVVILVMFSFQCGSAFAPTTTAAARPTNFQSTLALPRTRLHQSTDSTEQLASAYTEPSADYGALLKYHASIATQLVLIGGVFKGLDLIVAATSIQDSIPTLALCPLFYVLALKSRVFNPLDNTRPDLQKAVDGEEPSRGFGDRKMPSWTPPGVIFPIMWLLIIGPIRAYSSALIFQSTRTFFNPAIMALVFHLSVGDVWNTINNTEQRFGASVTGVMCVTASALNAAYQYYTVNEFAGHLLGLPMIWFAIASSLITATWRINPVPETGKPEPLYPVAGAYDTKFAWFGGKAE